MWRSNNILLPQSLKYVSINCGTDNLDTDNPDKISDRLYLYRAALSKTIEAPSNYSK